MNKKSVTMTFFAMLAVLLALGAWQVQRLGAKTALLERMAARAAMAPRPLPENIGNPGEWEFRKVVLAGRWLPDLAFFVGPRVKDGKNGYHAIVPFLRASGGIMLVNAGWVPEASLARRPLPPGITRAEGIVTLPRKGAFTPANDPEKDAWYWADPSAMAKAAGVIGVPPLVLVTDGAALPDIPNNHKAYAAFWFGMALLLCGVYAGYRRKR